MSNLSNLGPAGTCTIGSSATTIDLTKVSLQHVQALAATDWDIVHNLGFFPNVQVFDAAGLELLPTIVHVDINHVQIHHAVAVAGTANLS